MSSILVSINADRVIRSAATGADLNAALTAQEASGGGIVRIARNVQVTTTETIQVPPKCELRMDPGAEIIVAADVHGVELRGTAPTTTDGQGSRITGGRIRIDANNYTKAALYLDGTRVGASGRFNRQGAVRAKDVILQGKASNFTGQGIYLRAVGDGSNGAAIQWVDFEGMNIINFEDGVWLHADEGNATWVAFVNGNSWRGTFMQQCKNFWHYTCNGSGGGNGDISLNMAVDTIYQVNSVTERLIKVDGNATGFCASNYHIGVGSFDWHVANGNTGAGPAVELASGSRWVFVGVPLRPYLFSMGESNIIVGEQLRRHTGSTVPADPTDYDGSIWHWHAPASNREGLVVSDGKNWRPVVGTGGDRINYSVRQVQLEPLDLISRQMFAQNAAETPGVPTVFGLTRAACGSEVHLQRRAAGANEQVYVFCPNTAFTSRFYDPFAGTDSGNGALLRLDTQYAEVILRVLENNNVAILFKKGTISYASSIYQAQKTFDPPSIANSATTDTTLTVTGAQVGQVAWAFFTGDLKGVTLQAAVTSPNTVTVTFINITGAAVDIASGTLYALVIP